jgi:cell division protein FtsZ
MFELIEETMMQGARIKVIGVGGAGGNAINTMLEQWGLSEMTTPLGRVDFIVANTDLQALKGNRAPIKMQLGVELTKGLGAGADPEIGRKAAIESEAEITQLLEGADMVFITAGMGGGTGTGAAAVIARIAKDLGALTIGVVTKPFSFEGKRRGRFADQGIESLKESVDSLITIPNERLLVVAGKEMPMVQAFKKADEVLLHAVRGISDLILVEGLVNLDFADIRAVMGQTGMTLMGSGVASGEHRSIEAATRAISSPLLEHVSIRGATGILLNVTGGKDLSLFEVNEAAKLIQEEAHEEANIIFGAVIDQTMEKEIRVTVIATGFDNLRKPVSFTAYQRPSLREMNVTEETSPAPEPVRTAPERPRIPVHSDLKRILVDLKQEHFVAQGPDADEYDIPTFLRKHAD